MAKPDGSKAKASFFREVKSELKKVTYPTPAQTRKNTFVVIAIVLLVGVYIWALDFCFVNALSLVLEGRPAVQFPINSETQEQGGEVTPSPSPAQDNSEESQESDSGVQTTPEQQSVEEVSPTPEEIHSEPENTESPQDLPENHVESVPESSAGGTPDGQ